MSKEIEEWKSVVGYEGFYEVSNLGRVRSVDRVILVDNPCCGKNTPTHFKGRYLKPHKSLHYGKTRIQVTLSKNGEKKEPVLARLVYEAFVGKIPEGIQVNHIDEDPSNNVLSNLNLMSPKQNSNWGTRNQRLGETFKKNGKLAIPVDQIDMKTGEILASFPSAKEAARQTQLGQCNISRACNGGFFYKGKWINVSHAYGFIWKKVLIQPMSQL